jgi:hypothetical protein
LEIVVETQQRFTLRKSSRVSTVRCEQCSELLVFAEEAVTATGLSSRALHHLVETGGLHFAETPAGALLVCLNSFKDGAAEAEDGPRTLKS